jgi:hypothetical protein
MVYGDTLAVQAAADAIAIYYLMRKFQYADRLDMLEVTGPESKAVIVQAQSSSQVCQRHILHRGVDISRLRRKADELS